MLLFQQVTHDTFRNFLCSVNIFFLSGNIAVLIPTAAATHGWFMHTDLLR